jgi:hypothetical protein
MPIPARAALVKELHFLSHDGLEVRTAQHWSDPQAPADRPRSWLRLVCNGRVDQDLSFTGAKAHRELAEFWAGREVLFAPTALDERQMRQKLIELKGIEPVPCRGRECSAILPVGSGFCARCHRSAARVAGGAMSAARGNPAAMMSPAGAPESAS